MVKWEKKGQRKRKYKQDIRGGGGVRNQACQNERGRRQEDEGVQLGNQGKQEGHKETDRG